MKENKQKLEKKILDLVNSPSELKKLTIEELEKLSDELRSELIDVVSKTGGHLGAGLGVIELTIALHYVFNTPEDKLIWDVGHQAYPHKILTGRRKKMQTLRKKNGLSGFLKRTESKFDHFGAGHSSTSISSALGIAVARDKLRKKFNVIAVIGDGAMSAGMAYEAMNNAGNINTNMIIILNDNDMSIAPAVGALSNYLSNVVSSRPFNTVREIAKQMMEFFPEELSKTAKKAEDLARNLLNKGESTIFSQMGMFYLGPVDGHDVKSMVKILENLKDGPIEGPVLLHVVTEKGKGHPFSKVSEEKYHAVSKFNLVSGDSVKSNSNVPTYTSVFSDTLCDIAENDEKIIAITAAMPSGTGLNNFKKRFYDRFYDVGIAEQHAVTFAAGLAVEGFKPFVAIYSTFLQRAYDQVIHDVVIQKLPVRFMLDRAGLVGADGATHAGSFDLAYLSCLPNVVIMAPSNENELSKMVFTASKYNDGPIFCRYPRGEAVGLKIEEKLEKLKIGKGKILKKGNQIAVLSVGTMLKSVLQSCEFLDNDGYSMTIADARFVKPIDYEMLENLFLNHQALLIVEEGAQGGFSSHCLSYLSKNNFLGQKSTFVKCLTLPDKFQDHGSQDNQLNEANLDDEGILKELKNIISILEIVPKYKKQNSFSDSKRSY
ncbi:MAG: 1-deoxy-D-xylulose-5-phosphate synthase [SAR116 cluster bacterium]|nr:1-deoxy-D-xylulose-5-phosphate synthase [SAR116 cluster bacterium]